MANNERSLSRSALVLLFLLGNQAASADGDRPLESNQASPNSNAMEKTAARRGMTRVRAFFDRTEAKCFALGGLFALGTPGAISFMFPFAVAPGLHIGTKRDGDEVILTFHDDKCRIQMVVSKELRDGDQWLALHAYVPPINFDLKGETKTLAPGEKVTLAPGVAVSSDINVGKGRITLDDSDGDGFFTQGTGFYNDPQPQCLQRQDYFSVTRRGLTIWFLSPRDALTFSIEERLLSAEQGKLIRFVAPTCRLSVRVIKEIKIDGAWVPLEPAE
jgi:hypothetical protein